MKCWPALDVGRLTGRPDLFQAALLDYDVAAIDDNEPDAWRIFFHTADERDRAQRAVAHDFPDLSVAPIDVPDEDWAARSQASLRAIQAGNVVVAPPWDVPHDGDQGSGIGDQGSGGSGESGASGGRLRRFHPIPDPRSPIPDPPS